MLSSPTAVVRLRPSSGRDAFAWLWSGSEAGLLILSQLDPPYPGPWIPGIIPAVYAFLNDDKTALDLLYFLLTLKLV